MLFLVVAVSILLLIPAGLICVSVGLVSTSLVRAKNHTDATDLTLAQILNKEDSAGQMNNFVELSRESVYSSRATYNLAVCEAPELERLALSLLQADREGARHINSKRVQLIGLNLDEVRDTALKIKKQQDSSTDKAQLARITVDKVEVGYVYGVPSNVFASPENTPFGKYDREHGYVDRASGLYLGNISAPLKFPDDDLQFKFSALAAPMCGTIVPSSLISDKKFHQTAVLIASGKEISTECDQLPAALCLEQRVQAKTLVYRLKPLKTRSHAVTWGAAIFQGRSVHD